MKRLLVPTVWQAAAEVIGMGFICIAAFMLAVPAGCAAVGVSLLVLGNVRVSR